MSSATSAAYFHPDDRVWYVEIAAGARSGELAAFFRDLARRPGFGRGWRLVVDLRLSGSLVGANMSGTGDMFRAAEHLGPGVRHAIVYGEGRPSFPADVIRGATGFSRDELRAFRQLSDALTWLGLPVDYDLKSGEVITLP